MAREKIKRRLPGANNQGKPGSQKASNPSTRVGFLGWALILGNVLMLLFVIDYVITLAQPTFKQYSITFWLLDKLNE
jgi:hypothetical protein